MEFNLIVLANRLPTLTPSPDGLTSPVKGATLRPTFMATKSIVKPANSPAAVGPYNHAIRIGGLLFCAGQIPIDPATGNLVPGDIKAQTERVLLNIKAILDDQGFTFANVVKSTVFMTNLGDFAAMNEVYANYFTADFPARSTVQVAALPKGAAVEIEVVAHA
jgi:2-iminobutanoate/2-iminopropanoate deaminase